MLVITPVVSPVNTTLWLNHTPPATETVVEGIPIFFFFFFLASLFILFYFELLLYQASFYIQLATIVAQHMCTVTDFSPYVAIHTLLAPSTPPI